jgi:hypothetical protein
LLKFGGNWPYSLRVVVVQGWFSALIALYLHRTDSMFALIRPNKLWNHALMFINEL